MRVFDLHCDTIDMLAMQDADNFLPYAPLRATGNLARNNLALSGERMLAASEDAGDLDAGWCQCYAVWVPDDLGATGLSPRAFYERVQGYFRAQMAEHADIFAQARTMTEADAALASGRVAALFTVEGASPVGEDLAYLDRMYDDGVRMVTLTWNGKNSIASGHETTDGITAFGRRAILRMVELGIVIDVSHLNDQGFSELLQLTDAPFVASHSNSRSICGHRRNLTDDQFRAIVDRGGLVGINYYRNFITGRLGHGHEVPSPENEVTFEELAAHIEHFLDLGGKDALALGSDFDGSSVPCWLDGCQTMPAFRHKMAACFGEDITEKIFYENAHAFYGRSLR